MLSIQVPDQLEDKIAALAMLTEQTPEQLALELLEERIDHQSAYLETAYLKRSPRNRERLDQAIRDIRGGHFEERNLIDD
jgi:PHD/YefM family antitoxin component YafN of YafNO toxin-antitoxin module